jgi:hypothetical protein
MPGLLDRLGSAKLNHLIQVNMPRGSNMQTLLVAMGAKGCLGTLVSRAAVMPARADLRIVAGSCARP